MFSSTKYIILLLVFLFMDFMRLVSTSRCSNVEEFTCNNNYCIPITQRCDGQSDCSDSSDEEGCDEHHCREPDWFRCKNQNCISVAFLCDQEDDCGDNSDEQDCHLPKNLTVSKPTNCSEGEWKCKDRLCIPISWVCNGEADCLDGSDELEGCSQQKTCDGFKCKDGPCVSHEWRCDGTKDCKDGSDEAQCENLDDCKKTGWFQCANKNGCIMESKFCDGTKDCTDGSDEPDSCFNCNTEKCSHSCGMLPNGKYECRCPHGFKLANSTTCGDINECEIYGICDQRCLNTLGSYKCYCERGFRLQNDTRTCKTKSGEAVMIFSTKNEVRGFFLNSKLYYPIAKNLKQAIGVAYDGRHVYWTDIFGGHEQIIRSLEDGTHREAVVSAGLGAPEDLCIDWITGNIYFTDAEMQHIGVCTNNGEYCTVLINHGISKPRSIVLNPMEAEMYWTDWGKHPEIGKCLMDGTEDVSFVSNNIHWPNGLALDLPNSRLYWTDAKLMTLESIKLDGTGRRLIFEGIMKHPYGLDVFEDRLYWSDWITQSIESCDKFTGKDHHVLLKNKHVYGIHIYHSALQKNTRNPCELSFCSDICLLGGNKSYSCACPLDKVLGTDRHSCKVAIKKQLLAVATSNILYGLEYQELGSHKVSVLATTAFNITAMAYCSKNNSVFVVDEITRSIVKLKLDSGYVSYILSIPEGEQIIAMNYDSMGNNLYWCDCKKGVVEVLNLNSKSRMTIISDLGDEIPVSLSLVPEEGYLFVAFQKPNSVVHIDRFRMDGTDRRHVIEQGILGPVYMMYDADTHRIFWINSGTGNIESTSVDGDDKHGSKSLQTSPIGIASINKNLFWISRNSRKLYWTSKLDGGDSYNKNLEIDVRDNSQLLHLMSVTPSEIKSHPCQQNNGDCSDLCIVGVGTAICACPMGKKLDTDKKRCIKPKHCDLNDYFCEISELCISKNLVCNGRLDCIMGEDEANCQTFSNCAVRQFECKNKECIDDDLVCNQHFDCRDKSDEENCANRGICHSHQFKCADGQCLEHYYVCDGYPNCEDHSDEKQCNYSTCNSQQFRCASGACIPKNWECDKEFDCKDMSDEHKNCSYFFCESPKFACHNGLCIDSNLKCNKINDCGDYSDETGCPAESNRVSKCHEHEFDCFQNSSLCIPKEARCNRTVECPNRFDEHGCSYCYPDMFECQNKNCISSKWVCDHVDDCGDYSDENGFLCSHIHATIENISHSTCGDLFQCKSGTCLPMSMVCNDVEDCPDGSDENGVCETSCIGQSNPCTQLCKKTPSGPQCTCSPGYKLRGDGRTCTDYEECYSEPPQCSQICNEKVGSFECSCYDGYILKQDNRACKSTGGPMSLLFATFDGIYQLSLKETTLQLLYTQKIPKITGIDVSVEKGFVYFSAAEAGILYRIQIDHKSVEYISDIGYPQQVAVDWITENVYYIDGVNSKEVKVCNVDTRHCAQIFSINNHGKISAIAVDPINELIFHAVSNWDILDSPSAMIHKTNLDGSDTKEVVKASANYISGLTFNIHKRTLYYLNQHDGKIHKVDYDGTNQIAIINNLTKPASLSWFEDQLYFYIPDGMMAICPLFIDYQLCQDVKLHGHFNELFAIFHSSRQPNVMSNVCQDINCTSLCIPINNRGKCLCNLDSVYVGQQHCEIKEVFALNYGADNEVWKMENEASHSNFKVLLILLILAIIFIICGLGSYYYYQKKQSGKLDISMRFSNPVYGKEPIQRVVLQAGQHEYYNPTCDIHTITNPKIPF